MKEITHEEVKEKVLNMYPATMRHIILVYITQQQDKEERAKKEHELLELYRKKDILQDKRSSINMSYEDFSNHELTIQIRKLRKQIKVLEEE